MAQISTKFIADLAISTAKIAANAVSEAKMRLSNNAFFKARNAANSADVDILKVNASDKIEFGSVPQVTADPSAANDLARKSYVDGLVVAASYGVETFTLIAGDITNQYVDLAQVAKTNSVQFMVNGLLMRPTSDYTLNYTGGAGGKTRVSFAGDIATGGAAELVATDVIYIFYAY